MVETFLAIIWLPCGRSHHHVLTFQKEDGHLWRATQSECSQFDHVIFTPKHGPSSLAIRVQQYLFTYHRYG